MGLGYTPQVQVTGRYGKRITDNLLSWELIDASGRQSDQLTLRLDASQLPGLPDEGERLGFELGYREDEALTDKGQFKISRVTPQLYPNILTIVATAAPFEVEDPTGIRERKSRSFDQIKLGDLFRQLVQRHGYSPRVAPDLDAIVLEHVDQSDETDFSFISRIAKRFDAVAKPVDNLYVLARRGQVKSISGQTLEPVAIELPSDNTPGNPGFINACPDMPSRRRFNGVRANWWDSAGNCEREHSTGKAPFKTLRQQFGNEGEAIAAAEAEQRKLAREGVKVTLEVPGNAAHVAEGLITLGVSFPDYMAGQWSLDRVIARGNRGQGWRDSLEASKPL